MSAAIDTRAALAQALEALRMPCDRWNAPQTRIVNAAITAAEAALAAPQGGPLFLLHCGQIDGDGYQDDWDCEADSGQRVAEFCRAHPGQTVALYAAPAAPARAEPTDAEIDAAMESALGSHYWANSATQQDILRRGARAVLALRVAPARQPLTAAEIATEAQARYTLPISAQAFADGALWAALHTGGAA